MEALDGTFTVFKCPFLLLRLSGTSNGSSVYRVITPEQPNQQVLSMLQSISVTLSDVQGQLAVIQQQNEQRDSTLNRLEGEIQAMKRNNEATQDTPKSKRHRESPCGLSVSDSEIFRHCSVDQPLCSSVYGRFIHLLKMKMSNVGKGYVCLLTCNLLL